MTIDGIINQNTQLQWRIQQGSNCHPNKILLLPISFLVWAIAHCKKV